MKRIILTFIILLLMSSVSFASIGNYALVNNITHNVDNVVVVDSNNVPYFGSNYTTVDITGITPVPGIGWIYSNGGFAAPSPVPQYNLYLSAVLTGGDGLSPLGVVNNGTSSISVALTISLTSGGTAAPLTGTWRVPIRDQNNNIYDIVLVNLVNGQATLAYTTTLLPAHCSVNQNDFSVVTIGSTNYTVQLVTPITFIVYRAL